MTRRRTRTDRVLSPRESEFCCRYVYHGDAVEAYRESFEDDAPRSRYRVMEKARRLLRDPSVSAMIGELQAEWRTINAFTPEIHMNMLEEMRKLAIERDKMSVAVRCEELKGKAAGFYIDRHLNMNANIEVSEERAVAMLRNLLDENPDLVEALAPEIRELDEDLVSAVVDAQATRRELDRLPASPREVGTAPDYVPVAERVDRERVEWDSGGG